MLALVRASLLRPFFRTKSGTESSQIVYLSAVCNLHVSEEGEPTCTATVPAAAPSSVKVTVPEGSVDPTAAGVMLTDTGKVLPSAGVVVDGVTTVVVAVLATVNVTLGEIELL